MDLAWRLLVVEPEGQFGFGMRILGLSRKVCRLAADLRYVDGLAVRVLGGLFPKL
jgi:hypothetical protein